MNDKEKEFLKDVTKLIDLFHKIGVTKKVVLEIIDELLKSRTKDEIGEMLKRKLTKNQFDKISKFDFEKWMLKKE